MKRLRLIWWAILGRPIIYGVAFNGGFTLNKLNRNTLILDNLIGPIEEEKHQKSGRTSGQHRAFG